MLKVHQLSVSYPMRGGFWGNVQHELPAVRDVSFSVKAGEVLAIVGESGCGKSTLAQALVGLVPLKSGEIFWNGKQLSLKEWRTHAQMVFQDPQGSLNPRQTIREILTLPQLLRKISPANAEKQAIEAMLLVGLQVEDLDKYPHAFSGGQRQRIAIARALALRSEVLICDEPTSALDVSVQAQILHLLDDLRKKLNIAIVLITHDIGVVQVLADRVMVMYLGQEMEVLSVKDLQNAKHPYTQALLASVPSFTLGRRPKVLLGEIPSLLELPKGCVFTSRCPYSKIECNNAVPGLKNLPNEHLCRCILPQ